MKMMKENNGRQKKAECYMKHTNRLHSQYLMGNFWLGKQKPNYRRWEMNEKLGAAINAIWLFEFFLFLRTFVFILCEATWHWHGCAASRYDFRIKLGYCIHIHSQSCYGAYSNILINAFKEFAIEMFANTKFGKIDVVTFTSIWIYYCSKTNWNFVNLSFIVKLFSVVRILILIETIICFDL